jgi:hypothetical protein
MTFPFALLADVTVAADCQVRSRATVSHKTVGRRLHGREQLAIAKYNSFVSAAAGENACEDCKGK